MHLIPHEPKVGDRQADGRFFVKEIHEASDGQKFEYEYLAEPITNVAMVYEERAKIVLQRLLERENALLLVVGTEVPLTRFQFLDRMTQNERIAIRERAKTDVYVEDFIKLMESSGVVFLALARPGLAYLVQVGVFTAARAAIIGAE